MWVFETAPNDGFFHVFLLGNSGLDGVMGGLEECKLLLVLKKTCDWSERGGFMTRFGNVAIAEA